MQYALRSDHTTSPLNTDSQCRRWGPLIKSFKVNTLQCALGRSFLFQQMYMQQMHIGRFLKCIVAVPFLTTRQVVLFLTIS